MNDTRNTEIPLSLASDVIAFINQTDSMKKIRTRLMRTYHAHKILEEPGEPATTSFAVADDAAMATTTSSKTAVRMPDDLLAVQEHLFDHAYMAEIWEARCRRAGIEGKPSIIGTFLTDIEKWFEVAGYPGVKLYYSFALHMWATGRIRLQNYKHPKLYIAYNGNPLMPPIYSNKNIEIESVSGYSAAQLPPFVVLNVRTGTPMVENTYDTYKIKLNGLNGLLTENSTIGPVELPLSNIHPQLVIYSEDVNSEDVNCNRQSWQSFLKKLKQNTWRTGWKVEFPGGFLYGQAGERGDCGINYPSCNHIWMDFMASHYPATYAHPRFSITMDYQTETANAGVAELAEQLMNAMRRLDHLSAQVSAQSNIDQPMIDVCLLTEQIEELRAENRAALKELHARIEQKEKESIARHNKLRDFLMEENERLDSGVTTVIQRIGTILQMADKKNEDEAKEDSDPEKEEDEKYHHILKKLELCYKKLELCYIYTDRAQKSQIRDLRHQMIEIKQQMSQFRQTINTNHIRAEWPYIIPILGMAISFGIFMLYLFPTAV